MTVHRNFENATYATKSDVAFSSDSTSGDKDLSSLVDYPVEPDDEMKYYVEAGEWFYLNIFLSNPDSYEIQSFTLNGVKYASYMFETGSTLEKIVLHLQAPEQPGYFTFHIEAMKYIDNEDIRDVEMNADTTIRVGIPYENQPTCHADMEVYSAGARFDFKVEDPDRLATGYPFYFYLSDGKNIVQKKELALGDNSFMVQDLDINETYQYGVITAFDLADGQDDHAEWLVKETFRTKPPISFSFLSASKNRIDFALHQDDSIASTITAITLYDGITPVSSVHDLTTSVYAFDGLYSDHEYIIEVKYTYQAGEETREDVLLTSCRTDGCLAPEVSFEALEKGTNFLAFGLHVKDEDQVFTLKEVVLSDESGIIKTESERKDTYVFGDLLSDHTYFVKATYYYDLHDDAGIKMETTAPLSVTTLANVPPSLQSEEPLIADKEISVSYSLSSVLGSIQKIDLLLDSEVVSSIEGSKADFKNLLPDTEYEVRVTYSYDLKDGRGDRRVEESFFYRTLPTLEVIGLSLQNKGIIQLGDAIFFLIDVDNPGDLLVTKAVINGKTLPVNPLSSPDRLLVQFVNDGSLGVGETTFQLSGLVFERDGEEYSVSCSFVSESYVVNGRFSLVDAAIVDSEGSRRTYAFPDETLYLSLTFDNSTSFIVDSINELTAAQAGLKQVDENHYLLPLQPGEEGTNVVELEKIGYHNDYQSSVLLPDKTFSYLRLRDEEIVPLTDADDLEDIDDYRYYRLENDIDLSGKDFTGTHLKGYFDGNGHTISGMTYIGQILSNDRIALFKTAKGVINDLTLSDFFLSVVFTDDMLNDDTTHAAFLVGESEGLTIQDCHIREGSMLSFDNTGSRNNSSAGGFVGKATKTLFIDDSSNGGNILGDKAVGGFVGMAKEDDEATAFDLVIRRCENDGTIHGEDLYGGFVGQGHWFGTLLLEDVLNKGDIIDVDGDGDDSGYQSGAFVGYTYYNTKLTLRHGINTGESQYLLGRTDGVFNIQCSLNLSNGSSLAEDTYYNPDTLIIDRSYALKSPTAQWHLSLEQAMDPGLYSELGFDASLWDIVLNNTFEGISLKR